MSIRNWVMCTASIVLLLHSPAHGAGPTGTDSVDSTQAPLRIAQAARGAMGIPAVQDRPLGAECPCVRVSGFELKVDGTTPPEWAAAGHLAQMRRLLDQSLTGQPQDGFPIADLEDVSQALEDYIREQGYIVAQVFIPAQTVQNGIVEVQVLQGRLGRVLAEGNERYASNRLERPFQHLLGAPVSIEPLESALLQVTDLPGITVFGVLGEGADVGTSDFNLRVQAEEPFSVSASVDNYGTEATGEVRGVVSASWNNPTGYGDRLTLTVQQTASPTNGTYGGIEYLFPLAGSGSTVGVSYTENAYDVSAQFAGLGIEGTTRIGSLFFRQSMVRSRNFNLYGTASMDVERAETELGGIPEFEDTLSVLRLQLAFDSVDTRLQGLNQGSIEYHGGIKDFLGSMGDRPTAPFPSRRGGSGLFASGDFDKWYGRYSRLQRINDSASLLLRAELQYSDDLLTALEQFSLGGPTAVRAYPSAEVLADSAGFFSAELILNAPGFADKPAFGNRLWGEVFQVSVFFDYAGGRDSDPPPLETINGPFKTNDLSGYGLAFQLNVPGKFLGRLDVAKAASDRNPSNGDDPQFFARVNYIF